MNYGKQQIGEIVKTLNDLCNLVKMAISGSAVHKEIQRWNQQCASNDAGSGAARVVEGEAQSGRKLSCSHKSPFLSL